MIRRIGVPWSARFSTGSRSSGRETGRYEYVFPLARGARCRGHGRNRVHRRAFRPPEAGQGPGDKIRAPVHRQRGTEGYRSRPQSQFLSHDGCHAPSEFRADRACRGNAAAGQASERSGRPPGAPLMAEPEGGRPICTKRGPTVTSPGWRSARLTSKKPPPRARSGSVSMSRTNPSPREGSRSTASASDASPSTRPS